MHRLGHDGGSDGAIVVDALGLQRIQNDAGPQDGPAESFKSIIPGLMSKWSIPGRVVGLVKDEKLVYVEGFGVADKTTGSKPGPASLFRIASLSKPVTAAAVLKLVEDGLLSLDDKPFVMLDDLRPTSTRGSTT